MSDFIVSTDSRNSPMNLLNEGAWNLRIQRIPKASFLCKNISLPNVTIDALPIMTGAPRPHMIAGSKITYGTVSLTFKVDENMENYQELLAWMRGIVGDPSSDVHKKLITDPRIGRGMRDTEYNIYSQGSLITTTNAYKNNYEIILEDIFPIDLGSMALNQETDNSVNIECDVTFSCSNFRFNKII